MVASGLGCHLVRTSKGPGSDACRHTRREYSYPTTSRVLRSRDTATSAPLAARCSAPIRLAGERLTVDRKTGEIMERFASADAPDGVVLVACGNRRSSRWSLVLDDIHGAMPTPCTRRDSQATRSRGVSAGLASHPRVFATLTAPSFGCGSSPPGPRRYDSACQPGSERACMSSWPATHLPCPAREADPALGQPICPDCYDYAAAVLGMPTRWRSGAGTTIRL